MDVISVLNGLGYEVDKSMYDYIDLWKNMLDNDIKDFHKYREYNGKNLVDKELLSLGMPKKSAEDWADNIFNDNVFITVDKSFQEQFNNILEANSFRYNFPITIEMGFGLGTSALVEFSDKFGNTIIDHIDDAMMIYPIEVVNKEIVSCAFASINNDIIYLNIHDLQSDGSYIIYNYYFKKTKNEYKQIENENVAESYKSLVKCFQIIKPTIANNFVKNSGMGVSCFAYAVDEIKAVDRSFDSLDNEIDKGKKRLFVKVGAMGFNVTEDGETVPIFDSKQTTFYQLPGENNKEGSIIQETNADLRITNITDALQTNLNLFGRKAGLGDDYYSFKDGTIYTNNTQVISSNSKFYKTLKKHEKGIDKVIKELTYAIYYLETGKDYLGDVTIDFDDSIVEDKAEIRNQALLELNAGLIDNVQYYQDVYGMTEKQAVEFYETIQSRTIVEEEPILE